MKPSEKSQDKNLTSIQQLFRAYHQSHVNPTNQKIHYVCVPLIFWSISALLWVIKIPAISIGPIQLNLALISTSLILIYYVLKSIPVFLTMLIFSAICLAINYWIELHTSYLLYIGIAVFVVAWIGQFIGHKIEGKSPSFFQDLQFLLIGPAWVFFKLIGGKP